MSRNTLCVILVLVAVVMLGGCRDGELSTVESTTSPAPVADDDNLLWGCAGRQGTVLDKDYFVINHDNQWKIPLWVAYYLSDANLVGDVDRTDDFRPDPDLSPGVRAELTDYAGSGYDRGHNAPAGAFVRSEEAMSSTFVLSNMSPQTPQLNRGRWKVLESEVRDLVRAVGKVWIFTGNVFMDDDSVLVDPLTTIGTNEVGVPTHCFKALLAVDDKGVFAAYAFLMPNMAQSLPGTSIDYALSVDRHRLRLFPASGGLHRDRL